MLLRWQTVTEVAEGAGRFPMWGQGNYTGVSSVSADAARARGLRCRSIAESARDVLAWLLQSGPP